MKIENYYVGNICICTSITSGIANKLPSIKFNRLSKQIVFASIKNSSFLVPIQMIKNKQALEELRKAVKENIVDADVVLLKKHNVELAGDYFAEIDEQITPDNATQKQKEQILRFENLLKTSERIRSF